MCATSDAAAYSAARLSSAKPASGCARGLSTADTRNVVAPARARMRAAAGIGSSSAPATVADGRARPLATSSANASRRRRQSARRPCRRRSGTRSHRRTARRAGSSPPARRGRELDAGRRADAEVRAAALAAGAREAGGGGGEAEREAAELERVEPGARLLGPERVRGLVRDVRPVVEGGRVARRDVNAGDERPGRARDADQASAEQRVGAARDLAPARIHTVLHLDHGVAEHGGDLDRAGPGVGVAQRRRGGTRRRRRHERGRRRRRRRGGHRHRRGRLGHLADGQLDARVAERELVAADDLGLVDPVAIDVRAARRAEIDQLQLAGGSTSRIACMRLTDSSSIRRCADGTLPSLMTPRASVSCRTSLPP